MLDLSGEYQSDEEEFNFFRVRNRLDFDSSSGSEDPSEHDTTLVPDTLCPEPVKTLVYIDDYNSIERVKIGEAMSHISTQKRKIKVLAQKSEKVFSEVETLATDINMKVNASKTQLLCIYANNFNNVKSYIRTNSGEINSTDSLKILGFHFSPEPNANHHVTLLIDKFYSKLWTLRFLKKSGMSEKDLLGIFNQVIRPSVEYSSIVYHSLIPKFLSDKLESVQRQAAKIIFGYGVEYADLLSSGKMESLESRRKCNALKFATKAAASERFGKLWFKENPTLGINLRPSTRDKYVVKFSRTERGKSNPLQYLTRLLNEQYSSQANNVQPL